MKITLLFFATFIITCTTMAQGVLEVEDLTNPLEVYTNNEDLAALRIRCHQDIHLSFASTMDKSVIPFKTDIEGNDSIYYIELPTGSDYRGRILTIMAPGYISIEVPMELSSKQVVTLRITDPNSMVDAGCYRQHRNKGVLEIKNGNYGEARNQFQLASECSDCDKDENKENLELVDSLMTLRQEADLAYKLTEYDKAADLYNTIVGLNSYDTFAQTRRDECNNKFSSECTVTFKKAEAYFEDKEYDKARILYEKIIKNNCFQAPMATDRITSIDRYSTSKKYHATVLTYEWKEDAPIGFHIGKYNQHKAGGFFHMNLNAKVFDAIRNECVIGNNPEAMMGFGWTVKIVSPVWVHFGPGFGAKLYYGEYKKDKYPDKNGKPVSPDDLVEGGKENKVNPSFSVNPEIGLTIKYSYFALRATYLYRFALNKDLEDYMGKHHLLLGIGVAF